MFKQLRNRFLILNLVIISITMMISFVSIYLIIYNNFRNDIYNDLNKLSSFNEKPEKGPKEPGIDNKIPNDEDHFSDRSISFTLLIDDDNNLISYSSVFNTDEELYETAKEKAMASKADSGRFTLQGITWEFMRKSYPDGSGYKIAFIDVTNRYNYLTYLIYTFIGVALVTLIAIYFISRFFANRAIKPIKETFERQKQFVADASHELKTPLAVISTNAEVLLANSEDTIKNQSKWIYYIKSEVERMTKLTNDLLYLAQVDHSDVKLIAADFNLSETIESVILTMEASIFENNILLNYHIEPDLICHGNGAQIKQVAMILLDNALKYTNPNGSIYLSVKKYTNKAVMSVCNTGKGIPKEHLENIFHRFYRVDKSRSKNSGGYGLGLAIAKSIIEQHNGKIYVKSVVNENTTFTVEIPRVGNR